MPAATDPMIVEPEKHGGLLADLAAWVEGARAWLESALGNVGGTLRGAGDLIAPWLAGAADALAAHRLELAVLGGFLLLSAAVMLIRRSRQSRDDGGVRDLGIMTRGTRLVAFLVLAAFVGLGGGWAVVAPLASAAVATGVVSPEGARRSVQHLEGGIIRQIHVRDGDRVQAGDPLMTLEDVRARADNQVLLDRRAQLRAEIARLQAEQVMAEEMRLPADLRPARLDPDQASTVRAQLQLFDGRRATLASRRSVLAQRIRQLEEENGGLRAAIEGLNEQLGLIGQEIANVQTLFDRGLARMPRLLELQRTRAQVRIELAQNRASIARNLQRIGETEIEAAKLDEEWRERAASELAEARAELAEIESKLSKTQDALRRTTIAAPVGGVVVELAFTTEGGVVKAGERILDIVPRDSELLIDARVTPQDIDDVFPGLEAQVVLSAYNQRNMPEVRGRIRTVSADRLTDERTGEAYYLARVEVPKEQLTGLDQEIELIAGMPAEVMILTGNHTFFDYLIDPVVNSFNRSFRES
jgi:HlyD family secretion protein/epimerase transport system membrane fusion protein